MIEGYRLKLDRAKHHLDDLKAEIGAWEHSEPYSIVHEPDPDGTDQFLIRVRARPIPQYPFSLIVGDLIHNLRSSLDHLVHALSIRGGASQEVAHRTEFPIFKDHAEFKKRGRNKIMYLSETEQAIVESVQPYRTGDEWAFDHLWVLHSMSNIDKHRLLHPGVYALDYATQTRHENANVSVDWHFGSVEPEAVVAHYRASPIDPNLDMEVNLNPVVEVGGDRGPDATGALRLFGLMLGHVALVASNLAHATPDRPPGNDIDSKW